MRSWFENHLKERGHIIIPEEPNGSFYCEVCDRWFFVDNCDYLWVSDKDSHPHVVYYYPYDNHLSCQEFVIKDVIK